MDSTTELLDIKEAAAFLHVSETSLRRWTNTGQLRCYRLGGRRERRFSRADLLSFLRGRDAGLGDAAGHLCGLYASDAARVQQAVGFLSEDPGPHSLDLLVAAPDVREAVLVQLERDRPAVRDDVAAGRLVLSDYAESAAAQLEYWQTQLDAALHTGAQRLRIIGDVSGGRLARQAPFSAVLAYEQDYDRVIARRFPVTTLCLHDVRRLSGLDTAQLLRCHGDGFRYPVEHLVS